MSLKIQTALIPQKHIPFSGSLIGIAGFVRAVLKQKSRTLDELWQWISESEQKWPIRPTFEQITIAVLILFALGQLRETKQGKLEASV